MTASNHPAQGWSVLAWEDVLFGELTPRYDRLPDDAAGRTVHGDGWVLIPSDLIRRVTRESFWADLMLTFRAFDEDETDVIDAEAATGAAAFLREHTRDVADPRIAAALVDMAQFLEDAAARGFRVAVSL